MKKNKESANQIFLVGSFFVTIIISPWISYDPINIPKQLVLVVFAFLLLSKLNIKNLKSFILQNRIIFLTSVLFFAQLTLVILFAPGERVQQFFGATGRQTGFITYFSLLIIFLCTIYFTSLNLIKYLLFSVLSAGVVTIIYCLIQYYNLDPFPWTNPYSPVIGFFGNPNFVSSFVAFSCALPISIIFDKAFSKRYKSMAFVYLFISAYVIYLSNSVQGFLVLGIIFSVSYLFFVLKSENSKFQKLTSILLVTFTYVMVLIDILQKSPWNPIIYKPSVSYRGDFWRAGWQMTLDHPFFGVGLDSYRDWYFRSRDFKSSLRQIANTSNDSAHNIVLDLSSNGGFPLAIIYLILVLLVLRSVARIIKRIHSYDYIFVSLFGVWVGYQAQSLISINQIGLVFWGWVSAGLIIGYEKITRDRDARSEVDSSYLLRSNTGTLKSIAFGFIGLIIILPVSIADLEFRSAIDSRSISKIEEISTMWPQSPTRMNYIAKTFEVNGLFDLALKVATNASEFFPNNYETWEIIHELSNTPKSLKEKSLLKMKELNPHKF